MQRSNFTPALALARAQISRKNLRLLEYVPDNGVARSSLLLLLKNLGKGRGKGRGRGEVTVLFFLYTVCNQCYNASHDVTSKKSTRLSVFIARPYGRRRR